MYQKINILSDIHLEFLKVQKIERYANLKLQKQLPLIGDLVLAGDICSLAPEHLPKLKAFLTHICKDSTLENIYYLMGNHEFYEVDWKDDTYLESVYDELQNLDLQSTQLHICGKDPVHLVDHNVLMSTLWYPDIPDVWQLTQNMKDFSWIGNSNPGIFTSIFESTKRLIQSFSVEDCPRDWYFHHLPTPASIPSHFKTDRLNCYYLGDISKLIMEYQPRLVVHGHSHDACEYYLGNTLVRSNPLGYPK
jgi:predicted phosphodiesterase